MSETLDIRIEMEGNAAIVYDTVDGPTARYMRHTLDLEHEMSHSVRGEHGDLTEYRFYLSNELKLANLIQWIKTHPEHFDYTNN